MNYWIIKKLELRWLVIGLVLILFETDVVTTADHTCGLDPNIDCTRCDGVPQCFDLSDELGCYNTSLKLVPIKEAVRKCVGKGCIDTFPQPPPLPPFSLCKDSTLTTSTLPTHPTQVTPSYPTIAVTQHPTTIDSSFITGTATRPTQVTPSYPTIAVTQHPTTIDSTFISVAPTRRPVYTNTQWLPTTTVKPDLPTFMDVWWSCSTVYRRIEDTIHCVGQFYWCLRQGNCLRPLKIKHATVSSYTSRRNMVGNSVSSSVKNNLQPTVNSNRRITKASVREPQRTDQYKHNPARTFLPTRTSRPKTVNYFQGSQQYSSGQIKFSNQAPFSQNVISESPRWTNWEQVTQMPTFTAPFVTPSTIQQTLFNQDFNFYDSTNYDLMYALMVLQHF